MALTIYYYGGDNRGVELTPVVSTVKWSGEVSQVYRKLEVEFINSVDMMTKLADPELAGQVVAYEDGQEFFRGLITSIDKKADGRWSFVCKDIAWYTTKIEVIRIFRNMRADQIIRNLCNSYGIDCGTLVNTGFVIGSMAFPDGASIRDIAVQAITLTTSANRRRFAFFSDKGKMVLEERKKMVTKYKIEDGITISDASLTQSIDDMYNSVIVTGTTGDEKNKRTLTAALRSNNSVTRFGLMQKVEKSDGADNLTQAQVNAQAGNLLREKNTVQTQYSVNSALGIVTAISGTAIYCNNALTGLVGGYYIVSDSHSWDDKGHTMDLTINTTDDLPKMKYQPPTDQ
jgi:hypothetical protein